MIAKDKIFNILTTGTKKNRLELIQKLGESFSPEIVEILITAFNNDIWVVRKTASEVIVQNFGEKAIPILSKEINNPNSDISYWVIKTISQIGGQKAFEVLFKLLKQKDNLQLPFIIEGLGEIKNEKVIPFIIQYLGHEDEEISQSAYQTLLKFRKKAVPHLKKLLTTTNRQIKEKVFLLLAEILKTEALKSFIQLFKNSKSVQDKIIALKAIAQTQTPEGLSILLKSFNHQNWEIRAQIFRLLVEKYGEKAVKYLQKIFLSNFSDARYWAIKLIAKIQQEKALPQLIEFLKNKNSQIRYLTVIALSEIENEEAVFPLIESFNDESEVVRQAAYEGIIKLGSLAKREIEEIILNEKGKTKLLAIKLYPRIAGKDYSIFYELYPIASKKEKLAMISALSKAHNEESLDFLIMSLEDKEWPVRNEAHLAIRQFGRWAYNKLLEALFTNNDEKRWWLNKIITSLGKTPSEMFRLYFLNHKLETVLDLFTEKYPELKVDSKKYILTALFLYLENENEKEGEIRRKVILHLKTLENTTFMKQIAQSKDLTNINKILEQELFIDEQKEKVLTQNSEEELSELIELIELDQKAEKSLSFSFLKYLEKPAEEKSENTAKGKTTPQPQPKEKIFNLQNTNTEKNNLPQNIDNLDYPQVMEIFSNISKKDLDKYDTDYILKLVHKLYLLEIDFLKDLTKKYSLKAIFNSAKAMLGDADKYRKDELKEQFLNELKYRSGH